MGDFFSDLFSNIGEWYDHTFVPGTIMPRALVSEITTNPAVMQLDDAVRKARRNIGSYVLRKIGIDKPFEVDPYIYNENDFPESKLNVIDEVVRNKLRNRTITPGDTIRFSVAGEDYDDSYLDPNKDYGLKYKVFDDKGALSRSLGGFSVKAYLDNKGDTIYNATDIYDFDPKVNPKGDTWYEKARRFANDFNSLEEIDPDSIKNKINIKRKLSNNGTNK